MKFPKRGEIWLVSLDPTKGREIKKTRPCLVISRDEYNRLADILTIVPITSGKAFYPAWEVEIKEKSGLQHISHLLIPQIRIASKERFQKRIGAIENSQWLEIEEKLLFYLDVGKFFQESPF